MSKTTTPPPERVGADAGAGQQSPPDLGMLFRTGALFFGVPVLAVRLELADGSVQRLQLPSPADRDDPAADMTPKQTAVVQVVDEMAIGDVLGFDGIAERSGYSNSDDLRAFVRTLAMAGRLKKNRLGWERVK